MKLDEIKDLELLAEQAIINEANIMMEMANLSAKDTGLPYTIYIGKVGGQHGPRIKVSNIKGSMSDDCFVVSIEQVPEVKTPRNVKVSQQVVKDVKKWIVLNLNTLLKLWQVYETGEGESITLLTQLKKINH